MKRARDAVFDFGTHDYAFFPEVWSSVSSQGQQGSCSVPDVLDPGSADFRSGLILIGQIVVPLASSRPLADSFAGVRPPNKSRSTWGPFVKNISFWVVKSPSRLLTDSR